MENYLVDRETLGQFADALIATKYPGHPAAIYSNLRTHLMEKLDDRIGDEVFGSLNREQYNELNALLDDDIDDPSVFERFFKVNNLDPQKCVLRAVETVKTEFLEGGNHA